VDSIYDGTLSIPNPFPEATFPNVPDPVFAQFGPLVSSAITALMTERLNWHPEGVYELGNERVNREWDWGNHYGRPESMSAIRTSLAADPNFHVLIAHGIYDLITPYLATKLLLSQLPNEDFVSRVKLVLHEGGHMFYTHDSSRAALHEEARALVLNQ
jgi:carboxypeptidase C (cathepsin A)